MEDNNENKLFNPSSACKAWSKASLATTLTAVFSVTAAPAATPILFSLSAAFAAKAMYLSIKERREYKNKKDKMINTQQNIGQ